MKPFKRKRFIIDKQLQYRLLLYDGIYFLIITVSLVLFLFAPLAVELLGRDVQDMRRWEAAAQVLYLHTMLWPALFLILILLSVHAVIVSHRIAGPLFRFRISFEKIIAGNLKPPIRIRKNDFLYNQQLVIDRLIDTLRSKVSTIQTEQQAIESILNEKMQADLSLAPDLKNHIDQLKNHNSRLKKEIEFFSV
jgi:nitrogen fixation/metabolism regulation signal transduction histidine kinase